MGCVWELISFCLRSAGTLNQQSIPLAFASQLLVLLAPMWINAFIYMVMGRMIYFFIPSKAIFGIKGIKIAKIFVWLDVLSFLTQVGGGVMISPGNGEKSLMMGIHIYMGGIGFQEFCILLFTAIAIKFLVEMRALGATNQILDARPDNWRKLLFVLYAVLVLITVRIVYRLIEFAAGLDPDKNPLPYHEAYFMVLDALPMFVACALLNFVHPGMVLQGEGSEFPKGPSRKEKKEAKRVKKEEKKAKKQRRKMEKMEKKRGYFGSDQVELVERV